MEKNHPAYTCKPYEFHPEDKTMNEIHYVPIIVAIREARDKDTNNGNRDQNENDVFGYRSHEIALTKILIISKKSQIENL